MKKKTTKKEDKGQQIADSVQDKLSGMTHGPNLHKDETDKDVRAQKLEKEIEGLHEKYVYMERTWRNLALLTVGKEEADKMAKQLGAKDEE